MTAPTARRAETDAMTIVVRDGELLSLISSWPWLPASSAAPSSAAAEVAFGSGVYDGEGAVLIVPPSSDTVYASVSFANVTSPAGNSE